MTYGAMYDDELWYEADEPGEDYYHPDWVDCTCEEHLGFHENCFDDCPCEDEGF